jgi:hypothetical protein
MKTTLNLTAVALLAVGLTARTAAAQLNCGATVGPGEKITLTDDVGTCTSSSNPALTIVGPATVDMAGYRVVCDAMDPSEVGILLEGKGVKLLSGSILDCGSPSGHGLQVAGEGKHKIENFVVQGSQNHGVRINGGSDGNSFKRVASNRNGEGFESDSDKNKFEDVAAIANDGGFGFDSEDDGDKLKRVTFVGNGADGFSTEGSGNVVKEAFVADNAGDGVDFDGGGNKLEKSAVVRNGAGFEGDSGVELEGNGNQLKSNRVTMNDPFGVFIDPDGSNNKVTKTTALGNGTDLIDNTVGGTCDGNSWTKNVFGSSEADGTSDPTCIE